MTTLKAEKRSMDVKAKRLRREGFVTGNVIGREIEGSVPVKIQRTEAERLLKTCAKGSRITLEVDGEPMDVLIKEIDMNPLKGQIQEMDFQALVNGEKVHSVAEVYLLNHENVTTGILQQHLQEISYRAVPAALVEKVGDRRGKYAAGRFHPGERSAHRFQSGHRPDDRSGDRGGFCIRRA